ncbi:MAG TPA: nuclear transport factor 2 family protein [Thermoleophilaceae bacterium]|jgi:steroid delta-isomerase-like uncharacterized protein|nr:nuclear transport factor 2 family protein [Thermoleophilaceae bacterium]
MTDTTTAERLDPAFVADFSQRWLDAWNKHDGDALAQLVTEDVEFTDPAIGTVHGRAPVAEWVRQCGRAFPDYVFEEPEPFYLASDGSKVIAPWRMRGTNTGPIDPPGFAPTGRPVVLEGVDHWWFRDGLLSRYRADYDTNGLLRQLGLVPEPGSRGERAMVGLQRLAARFRRS